MKKTLFIFGIFLFALSFATAMGDSGQIKVVGQFEQPEVSIIVPDQINLPIVANGYSTKNSFEITNKGIKVGKPLTHLRGILTGNPEFINNDFKGSSKNGFK